MASMLRKLTPRERTWALVGGILIGGTVVKVAYFKYCRDIFKDQAAKTHQDALANLEDAQAFAKWAHEDRMEKRKSMPQLTEEQEQQMREYREMMNQYYIDRLTKMTPKELENYGMEE